MGIFHLYLHITNEQEANEAFMFRLYHISEHGIEKIYNKLVLRPICFGWESYDLPWRDRKITQSYFLLF